MQDFITQLQWRGMVQDIVPNTITQLQQEKTKGYIGFDLTASSLHIGNLATIMLLKHLQRAGHQPVVLLGGATSKIGDPSGKSAERNLLEEEVIRYNQECIQKQFDKFLDFSSQGALLFNNLDWFKKFDFLHFLRDVGKYISVNYMMAKESVKKRLTAGISFTEFCYQLLQAYDFYHLYVHHQVKLQMGGADQWGNLTTGTELIRKKIGKEAFVLTTPLITKADGSKFGKTASGNNIWLDPTRTSPYAFYQFWCNCTDEEAIKFIKVFTFLPQEEIEALITQHQAEPHQRILQKKLAKEVTIMVHSPTDYVQVDRAVNVLFGNTTPEDVYALSEEELLMVLEQVPKVTINKSQLDTNMVELLSTVTQGIIFSSKGESRRMIQGGGVSINKVKITEEKTKISLLQGKYLLVQKGKKNYYLIVVI